MADEVIAETVDPDGRRVVLDADGLRHILRSHGELAGYERAIMDTVSMPEHRDDDPAFAARERFYRQRPGPSRWLAVVVDYSTDPAVVITSFGRRADPPGWESGS
jgi:hypothetical protein